MCTDTNPFTTHWGVRLLNSNHLEPNKPEPDYSEISDTELLKLCLSRGVNPKIRLKHRGYKGVWYFDPAEAGICCFIKNTDYNLKFQSKDGTIKTLVETFEEIVDQYIADKEIDKYFAGKKKSSKVCKGNSK